jgi:hypothetical protein
MPALSQIRSDQPLAPPLYGPASVNLDSVRVAFVYSNGKRTFAGRVTAGGVVLDTPAVNGGALTLAASARNTYFLYSAGEDDEKLMASRLFLRTLASPDPQPGPVRRHAAH